MSTDNYLAGEVEYWVQRQPLIAGRLIFENLRVDVRPKWACNILQMIVHRTGIKLSAIDNVLQIASDPNQWNKAHDAFTTVRLQTLKYQRKWFRFKRDKFIQSHLALAELVAKVTYNSTNTTTPFDANSGWYIPSRLKRILDEVKDSEFSHAMWAALVSFDNQPKEFFSVLAKAMGSLQGADFENLFQFFGGYFYECFGDDFETPETAVECFIEGNDRTARSAVIEQLRYLITECPDEELEGVVFTLGCYHKPLLMGEWLQQVLAQLENSLKDHR